MRMLRFHILLWGVLACTMLNGRAADGDAPKADLNEAKDTGKEAGTSAGNLVPRFDPDSEVVTWNGQVWNINDNRAVRAKLEKYLNESEEQAQLESEYQDYLDQITNLLAPGAATQSNLDKAWGLLSTASSYPSDAHLCDSIADAVYAVWQSRQDNNRLDLANKALAREIDNVRRNMEQSIGSDSLSNRPPKDQASARSWAEEQQLKRQTRVEGYTTRLEELNARYNTNRVKREGSDLESRIQFQSLIVQLFMFRRFEHVLIATRFYRALYGDGDSKLNLGDETKSLFSKGSGVPPTLAIIDTMANEAIEDVNRGMDAYVYLMGKGELDSGVKRLTEAYALGEHLPLLRKLNRDQKRQGLEYLQKSNRLLAALEVKDYEQARQMVEDLQDLAKDFTPTKPMAAIRTAETMSSMHLAKAQAAAASNQQDTFERELKAAAEIWPTNPKLEQLANTIFAQVDQQQQALSDLDRLIGQKNYREIYTNKLRFIAATAMAPEKQKQLGDILEKMQAVELSIAQAHEMAKRGDTIGAWETIELARQICPEDSLLNQERADYTVAASDFVNCLQKARSLEEKEQYGSSLGWYLEAYSKYALSSFAKEGIERLSKIALETQSSRENPSSHDQKELPQVPAAKEESLSEPPPKHSA